MEDDMSIERTEQDGMALFTARPEEPAPAAVMVFHGAYGPDPHVLDVLERLASQGYYAVAPHLFHRTQELDDGTLERSADTRRHRHLLTEEGILDDVDSTFAHLAVHGYDEPSRIGLLGFCLGGAVALIAASNRAAGAAVTFYGSGVTEPKMGMRPLVELAPLLRAPWLGLYGDEDHSVPPEQVDSLEAATASAKVATEVVRYPGAGHGFHNHTNPKSYHESSAKDGWQRASAWLSHHISEPASS
jgi:carboxymethylenebutenolidase